MMLTYMVGNRRRSLLIGAAWTGGAGLALVTIFGSTLGDQLGKVIGPRALIVLGIVMLLGRGGSRWRSAGRSGPGPQ